LIERRAPRRSSTSALLVLVAFAAVAAFVAIWFPMREYRAAFAALEHKAARQAELIAYTIAPAIEFGDPESVAEALRGAARDADFVGAEAFDSSERSVGREGDLETGGHLSVDAPIALASGPGRLRLVMSTAHIDATKAEQLLVGLASAATILLLGLLVSLWIDRTIREITELMMENQRQRAAAEAANEVKSRFLANVSHEIRTPLNAVMGLSDVLSRHDLDDRARPLVGSISRAAQTLLALVNDVLDLSRVQSGRLELESAPFDPGGSAKAVAEMFMPACRERGLELSVDVRERVPPRVMGDRLRFEQVLTNLAGNAVKFTAAGHVAIELDWRPEGVLAVSVRDTGIGIAADKLETIFDAFAQADTSTTRRFGGTGLGLAISRELARAAGGDIVVESTVGRGSTFTFAFPSARAPDRDRDGFRASLAQQSLPPARLSILIAEDDETNRLVISSLLGECGLRAEIVTNGREALERVTSGRDYDLVLMDCQMPELDGYEATARIRAWERENGREPVTIVAVTAHAIAEERAKTAAAGMNGHVTKPLTLAAVRAALREHAGVEGRAAGEAAPASERNALADGTDEPLIVARMEDGVRARAIVETFERGCDTGMEAIDASLRDGRWDELRSHAHRLKGSCLMIGARRAATLAGELEAHARAADGDAIGESAFRLELALSDVRDRLRDGLDSRL
jgi:signal transduction histidine kinase/DNA-binding NarL/FixJ family response regulator